MKKNITVNTIIYSLKTIIGFVFPLITFPYAARILSVDALGKVTFASSIISYFSLLAGLGIYTFAVKNGAKLRDNREEFNQFSSEIFTLNLITTVLSYLLFFILLLVNEKWHQYGILMLIISMTIPLTTMGMDWVFTIYEEYFYVTVRSLGMQLFSVIFLFLFVKDDTDIYFYALYTVLTTVGSNLINFFQVRKYTKIRICLNHNLLLYLKPIFILFASSVACQIYLNSDITILGYLSTDSEVGLYNASVKIYNLAKNVLLSLGTVSMPRLAFLIGKKDTTFFDELFIKIFKLILILVVPATVGLAVVGKDAIVIFAGKQYVSSGAILQILAFALPFSIIGSYVSSGCLVLFGKEMEICVATTIGAVLNIVLNIILIPWMGAIGAACTTVLSEMVTLVIHIFNIKKVYYIHDLGKTMFQVLSSSLIMFGCCVLVHHVIEDLYLRFILVCGIGIIVYFLIMLLQKNELLYEKIEMVKNRLKK